MSSAAALFSSPGYAIISQPFSCESLWKCYRLVAFLWVILWFSVVCVIFERITTIQKSILQGIFVCIREVYRRYEAGLREIPVWALIKLSELYNVSTDYILGLTDDPRRA